MKILAGFYTNNRLRPQLLQQSLNHFLEAARNGPVIPIVSSWERLADLPCQNLVSHFQMSGQGHLNILLQLLQIIHSCDEPWDYFAFCEHDCLYPPDYFADLVRCFSQSGVSGLASENHVGMRPNGFSACSPHIQPLFAMAVRRDHMLASLQAKLRECVLKGWCCIEPDDRTDWIIIPPGGGTPPVVHVNMDTTQSNHHLTNHSNSYSLTDLREVHSFWGDFRRFGIFTETEIDAATRPVLTPGTYRIVDAQYGDFATGRLVSYFSAIERKNSRGLFQVSNAEAGLDPAPGVIKLLRLQVSVDHGAPQTLEFREGSVFRL